MKRRIFELEDSVRARRGLPGAPLSGLRERIHLIATEAGLGDMEFSPAQAFAVKVVSILADAGYETIPIALVLEISKVFGFSISDLIMEGKEDESMEDKKKKVGP